MQARGCKLRIRKDAGAWLQTAYQEGCRFAQVRFAASVLHPDLLHFAASVLHPDLSRFAASVLHPDLLRFAASVLHPDLLRFAASVLATLPGLVGV